jgi:1,4-dihydroxy-2-naphthoate octaprenyltransferase
MTKSTFLHLRLPFSLFLLPIFLLAASLAPEIDWRNFALAFAAFHLLLYPAANSFNSYYDRDNGSIGLLETPPPVEKELLAVSLLLDLLALLLGLLVSWRFAAGLAVYSVCSKLYSHPGIRLKRRPVASLLGIGLVQGGLCFVLTLDAVQPHGGIRLPNAEQCLAALLCSLTLFGFYPLTQIYQHEEDARRGDKTISLLLGTRGTLILSGTLCGSAAFGFLLLLARFQGLATAGLFLAALLPATAYFLLWTRRCLRDPKAADYRSAMRLSFLGTMGMNVFCALLLGESLGLLQL